METTRKQVKIVKEKVDL